MNFSLSTGTQGALPVVGSDFETDVTPDVGADASGVFKLEKEQQGPMVIELPEHLRGMHQDESDEEGEGTGAQLPSGGGEALAYVPGLQFVGKAKLRQGSEAAPKKPRKLAAAPILAMGAVQGTQGITDESGKFRIDMESRPELSDAAYESMPVEEFGKALLRGMGWREGKGVGLSNRSNVEPIQYIPRPERLGLGAAPKALEAPPDGKRRRIARPGDEPDKRNQEYVTPTTKDGKVKHYVGVDHGLVAKQKLAWTPGALIGLVDGPHEGLLGKIISLKGLDAKLLSVELGSGARVDIRATEAVLLDSGLLQRKNGMDEVKRIMSTKRKEIKSLRKAEENDLKSTKKSKKDKKSKKSKRDKLATWLMPGIVVRCISKSFQGGKLYQKKLVIVDMVTPVEGTAVLLDNRGKLYEGITKALVETALPQPGVAVCIIQGPMRGLMGILQERSSEKNRAIVQLDEDATMQKLTFDDVAQYVGTQ